MASGNTMRKVSLRNVAAHKLRLALTLLAVVLGTAFIAGSFMFTKSLSSTLDSAVSSAFDGVDVAVSSKEGDPMDAAVRDKLREDPDVGLVNIRSSQTVVVASEDLDAFQTGSGGASLSPYYPEDETVGKPGTLESGAAPEGTGEVLVNDSAAEDYGIKVGDKLVVVHPDHRETFEVSGIYKPAVDQGTSIGLLMDAVSFTEVYGEPSQLVLSAADGVEAQALVDHLNEAYPDLQAESGEKLAEEMTDMVGEALKFVNYFLVAFGLIALLVGTFIIANTFSMIVAQRTKEFALLRALGASRGQITRSVVGESIVVGLIGSVLGVIAGVGLVAIIKAVMSAQGMPMGSSLGLSLSAVVVPVLLGTVVTVVSAWAPARRAGSVEPVEAMRSTEQAAGSSLKVRTVIGLLIMAVGIALAWAGVASEGTIGNRASLVGVGAFALIVGFFLAGPALSLPIVPTLGRIIGAPFGAIGKLAATNSRRNPRRTAATAFALTLGMALVTAIGMLGDTMKSSVADTMESQVSADYILSGPQSGNFPTPTETPDLVRDVPGVDQVISLTTAPATVDGEASLDYGPQAKLSMLVDADPAVMVKFDMVEGTSDFDDGFIAAEGVAADKGWKVGESYPLEVAGQPVGELTLQGVFGPNQVIDKLVMRTDAVPDGARDLMMVGVTGQGDNLRADLEDAVKDLVIVQVQSAQDFAGQAAGMIDQMLTILYGLLALAVIIAVLGIVNTLTLGVIERRQEIGMLRAVGTQRRQIRTMISLEAIQIAIFGAVMGVVLGLGLGWAFIKVLSGAGLESASVPWGQVVIMLVASGVVGWVASLWPASRAAKTPPLDAIAE